MLAAGTRLGPYEVLSSLGAGGMGEVYRARDTRLDRVVAVKILPPQLAADHQFRERFDREARAVSALDHPHICSLYDVGEHPSTGSGQATAYLVMPLLEGETLAERLEGLRAKGSLLRASGASAGQAGLSLDEALRIATQVCDALDHAHRIGVVHRDLKPAQYFSDEDRAEAARFRLWVAYVSDESGREEIYVQPYPGPGGKRQVSTDGGSEPVWASNGRELFYWADDKMMAVSVATAPTFSADTPRLLFEGRFDRPLGTFPNFDVTADGQRFLMFKGTQAAAPAQITVVLDWATELARRVPVAR